MHKNLPEFENIFNQIPKNSNSKSNNLFSIGTRGFYENPFTEVLSYLINENSNYKYREQFIRTLLKDLNDDSFVESLVQKSNINTQFTTDNGKFIDLIIYNDKNILVFENKIHHWLANPFEEYERDINQKYPIHNKKFIILSYKKVSCPKNWTYINIRKTFDILIKKQPYQFDDKWDYFVHDFLIQFSNNKLFNMEKSYFDFYEKNFPKIIYANSKLKEFFIDIAEKIKEEIEINRYKYSDNWGEFEHSIRFYPFNDENNITLIFKSNGKFNVAIYYYNRFDNKNEIHQLIDQNEYEFWNEEQICCFAKLPGKEYPNLEDATAEIISQLEKQIKYYS